MPDETTTDVATFSDDNKVTKSADQNTKDAAAKWEEERTWPMFNVVITGDEVEWVARPGVNEQEVGKDSNGDPIMEPQPWTDTAKASVRLRARSKEHAGSLALRANPDYYTVESVEEVKED